MQLTFSDHTVWVWVSARFFYDYSFHQYSGKCFSVPSVKTDHSDLMCLYFPGRLKVCKYMWLAQVWSEPTHTHTHTLLHNSVTWALHHTSVLNTYLWCTFSCLWNVGIRVNNKLLFTGNKWTNLKKLHQWSTVPYQRNNFFLIQI